MIKILSNINKKDVIAIILLIVIAVFSHQLWYNFGTILNNNDWGYQHTESVKELYTSYGSWVGFSNFGSPNTQIYFNLYRIFWAIGADLGLSYDSVVKLTLLIPVSLLGFITPYILSRRLFHSSLISFAVALFYGTTTYFLMRQTAHLPIAFVYSLAPLVLWQFINCINLPSYRNWILLTLISLVGISYELRMMYIVFFVLFLYLIFHSDIKSVYKLKFPIILSGFILILLNLFWFLPTLNGSVSEINKITDRPLWGSEFFSLPYSLSNFESSWTGTTTIPFVAQPVIFTFWIIPIIAFSTLLFLYHSKKLKRKSVLFFLFVALVGIFLSKQEALPFPHAYEWLYKNFPGFDLFRVASKFYLLITIGYLGLLGHLLLSLKETFINKGLYYVGIFIIIVISLFNLKPLVTGELKTMFVNREIPQDYLVVKKYILSKNDYFRTLWVPSDSRWGIFTSKHPKIRFIDGIGNNESYSTNPVSSTNYEKIFTPLKKEFSDDLLNISTIKYVIVPLRDTANDDDFFIHYGGRDNPNIRQWYIDQLDAVPYLKRIDIGTKELVIYENENYFPYLRTATSLTEYNSFIDFEKKYNFVTNTLDLPFDFVQNELNVSTFPVTRITQPFENLISDNFIENIVSEKASLPSAKNILYTNTSKNLLTYQQTGSTLVFQTSYVPSLYLGTDIMDEQYRATKQISSIEIDNSLKHIALVGSQVFPLVPAGQHLLGAADKAVTIYEISNSNSVPNGSFEDGLWQEKVGDCNNYDDEPAIAMVQSKESSTGSYSLELISRRHIACTNIAIDELEAGELYLFSFDYQGKSAKEAGFYLSFDKSTSTVISERLPITNDNWQTYERIMLIPESVDNTKLHLYAYATNETTNNIVRYDNVQISKLREIATVNPSTQPHFEPTPLPDSGEYVLNFSDSETNLSNNIENGDLTQGLWKKEVGDCNNYDDAGVLDMRIVEDERDDGKSLELEASRHTACTGPNSFKVTEDNTYLFSFDYRSESKTNAGFNIGWTGTTTPSINERLPIADSEWHTYSKQVTVPNGATSASLLVYAYEKDGVTPIKVRYDNLSFIKLPDIQNRYYVVSDPQTNFVEPQEITFDLINPTKKLVHIKGATTPFYLAMSESFHPQWQAQFNNEKINGFFKGWVPFVKPDRIPDEHHFELNGFLNGWYVDTEEYCKNNNLCTKNPDGSYDMELVLEFFPQRWFYLGLLISGTTFVSLIGYLIYDFVRRRRIKLTDKEERG